MRCNRPLGRVAVCPTRFNTNRKGVRYPTQLECRGWQRKSQMRLSLERVARSVVFACILVTGWTEAKALEGAELPQGTMVIGQSPEEFATKQRRILHVAEKLHSPENAGSAKAFYSEILRHKREPEDLLSKTPSWLERMLEPGNPKEDREIIRKGMAYVGILGVPPGVGLVQVTDVDKKILEHTDRISWQSGCGGSSDWASECRIWVAWKFANLEEVGEDTPLMRRLAVDLQILPTNSELEAYGGPEKYGDLAALLNLQSSIPEDGSEPKTVEKERPDGTKGLLQAAEELLDQELSRTGLEARMAELSTEPAPDEPRQDDEKQLGVLHEYQQRMLARIRREIRADIYGSLGTFVSFVDPELGSVIAIGFPAVERLADGLITILSGTATMAAFGDVLGGAAALTKLVSSLAGSDDAVAQNFRMIQKGLGTISGQVSEVDRKVEHVMELLGEVATTVVSTREDVRELRLRMEEMHRETIRQFGNQSRDIRLLAKYTLEVQQDDVTNRMTEVESCVDVVQELQLKQLDNWESDYLKCRRKAFNLAELAGREIYTGITLPISLEDYFDKPNGSYNAADAHWLAGRWHKLAKIVVNAKVEAAKTPLKYPGLFESDETEFPDPRKVATTLSKMQDGLAKNPLIWHTGVQEYVDLVRLGGAEVRPKDQMTRELIDSVGQMRKLLKFIEDGDLASGAMELHLWNGHRLVEVLKGLWSEYLNTKEYRFTTCKEDELAAARRGQVEQGCYARYPWWRGYKGLVFDYWLHDYDEKYIPTEDPVKLQAMLRLLIANDGRHVVESKVSAIEEPRIDFSQEIDVIPRVNHLVGPGIIAQWQNFPAIYGDVGVSWTGCLKIAIEHRIKDRPPFGFEVDSVCVGDEPRGTGSVVRWRQFVSGGGMKEVFRPSKDADHTTTSYCRLNSEDSFLATASYDGKPMVAPWTRDGSAYIREGSLVLNQVGLTLNWEQNDELYNDPEFMEHDIRKIKNDAFRLITYESGYSLVPGVNEWRILEPKRKCEFRILSGILGDRGFFSDKLWVEEIYPIGPPIRLEGRFNQNRKGGEANSSEGDKASIKLEGAVLLFEPTDRNITYLKDQLADLIFNQEVARIIGTLMREMAHGIRDHQLDYGVGDGPTIAVDVAEYQFAVQQTMAEFVKWAFEEINIQKDVQLNGDEMSLQDALLRLDESWKAVQVLSRVVAGTCTFTPGGVSFEALARDLASGKDVENFLTSETVSESRFHSWTKLRRDGLLGVTSAGLAKDAMRLKERVGALDKWPLQTEMQLATYGEGAILLASLDAAVAVVREAARRSGVVVASEHDTQGLGTGTVAVLSRRELETALQEHEIAIEMGLNGIKFVNVDQVEGTPNSPSSKESAYVVGVPVAWLHADKEVSAFDVAVRKVPILSYETPGSEEASKLKPHAIENVLQNAQSVIGDILGGRVCRPSIGDFDDGVEQLESIIFH